jgi:hypothetical protein
MQEQNANYSKKDAALQEVEEELHREIRAAVKEYAEEMELKKMKSLSRYDPEKVAKILYLFSTGNSQTRLVKQRFKELGGKLAARNYVQMSSLEEDLIQKVRDRMENDPEMQVSFKDLKELSIAKANANREALTARGEATTITEERKVLTDEDYAKEVELARQRLAEEAKVIEVEEEE